MAWRPRSLETEVELVHHPCRWKTEVGDQEGEEVEEGEEHHLLAEVTVVEAQQSILLLEVVAEGEGQKNRDEEGRRMEMVATVSLNLEILQEEVVGKLLTLVVVGEEQEVERSLAWHQEGIQLEELVEDGLD